MLILSRVGSRICQQQQISSTTTSVAVAVLSINRVNFVHSSAATVDYDLIPSVRKYVKDLKKQNPSMTAAELAAKAEITPEQAQAIIDPLPERFVYPPLPEPEIETNIVLSRIDETKVTGFRRNRFCFSEVGKGIDNTNRRITVRDIDNTLRPPTLNEYKIVARRLESFAAGRKRKELQQRYVRQLTQKRSPLVMSEFDEYEERRAGWRIGGLSQAICLEPETAKHFANTSKTLDNVVDIWEEYLDNPEYDSDDDDDAFYPKGVE